MPTNMRFDQVFWNPNFGDYSGFDSVCEYVRNGRQACSAVADFLKARAQIEETYAKQLATLTKNQDVEKFEGTLGKGWEVLLGNTLKESSCHQKLAEVFHQQFQLTSQLTKTLKQKAKENDEEVRNCQNACHTLYEKALKNKSEFSKKANQKRQLEQEKTRLKAESECSGSNTATLQSQGLPKELQKLDVSIRKAATSADACKADCVKNLVQLDVAKRRWEGKTSEALTKYHEIEKSRIIYLRGLFWKLMNAICQACVDVDKACDEVRNILLICDPDADLQEFICLRTTGTKRPGQVTFENLGEATTSYAAEKSFKKSISRKLAKLANGQSTASVDVNKPAPLLLNQTSTSEKGKNKKKPPEYDPQTLSSSYSENGSVPASPSPTSPSPRSIKGTAGTVLCTTKDRKQGQYNTSRISSSLMDFAP